MIKMIFRNQHQGFRELDNLDEAKELLEEKANMLWVDLVDPSRDELLRVSNEFNFHPLSVEDALAAHQLPKINEYKNYFFLVFYAIALETGKQGLAINEISMFLGENYLVTVHKKPVTELDEAIFRWERNIVEIDRGISVLLYSLLDALIDNYFPIMDSFSEQIENLEEALFERSSTNMTGYLLQLKRTMLQLRRVVTPERDIINVLTRHESPIFSPNTSEYFQDIYDHILRLTDTIDNYRDLLSSTLDANLSVISNELNKVMRTMTAASIILMTDALIAGIYGMNFEFMPELKFQYGYFGALGLMLGLSIGLLIFFKRRGWF